MTALKWDLIQNNDKIALQLSGELSRNTLLPLWQQRASFLSEKLANQSTNPPEQLLTLADLVNLSHWIGTFIDHH